MSAKQQDSWLPTGRALVAIGLSRTTLHRWKREGVLEEGLHYRRGLTPRSPIRWNTVAIELAISAMRELPGRPDCQSNGSDASIVQMMKGA